jgi:energy-coupling factor transporter ATP-binding protein EcfA2
MNEETITYFAQTDARSKRVNFGIKAKDRTKHVYVIGKTGMGKSTLLENMAVQDIKNGEGMAFIDPHGKSADLLLEYVPPERIKDVLYFAPFDTEHPISFNVLESVDPDKRHLVVSGLISTFKKIWVDTWSARMEYILTNTLLALLEYPGATLLGVNRMLADKDFRKDVVDHVTDISVKNFWVKEFASYTERMAAEAVPAIQNKIGQFTANALIRNMLGQPKSSFDIREMMDDRKIIIINLSKGRIGESNANLLGGMLITKIYLAAMSRADMPERVLRTMPNFYLYVDEFQSFANESFADILSEARKYKLNLTIAHQYIEQMEEEVRAAVFGNVGTMIIFRVGAYDAEILEKEFAPTFTAEDIVNLGQYQIYLKLMIDGISSAPFSATNMPPIAVPEISSAAAVIASSREQFAHSRASVEETIVKWHEPLVKKAVAPAGSQQHMQQPQQHSINHSAAHQSFQQSPHQYQSTDAVSPAHIKTEGGQQVVRQHEQPLTSIPKENVQKANSPAPAATAASTPHVVSSSFTSPIASSTAPHVASHVVSHVAPISLSALSKDNNSNSRVQAHVASTNSQKIPTSKNVNDLKSALASIIGSTATNPADISKSNKSDTGDKGDKSNDEKVEKADNSSKPKEVPKEVLEKILKMN